MQASAYVQPDTYHRAIDRLEAIARNFDPADPNDLRSLIIQVLGEDLNIWPDDCFEEARRHDAAPYGLAL